MNTVFVRPSRGHVLLRLSGVVLNLLLVFGPIGVITSVAPWSSWGTALFSLGITALYWVDSVCLYHSHPRRPDHKVDGPAIQLAQATGLAVLFLFWISLLDYTSPSTRGHPVAVAIGAGLCGVGTLLRGRAVRVLGAQFVTEIASQTGQRLVQTDVYGWLRHPSETGLLLALAGAAIVLQSRWGLTCWLVVLVPLTWARLRWEEQQLRIAFGDDYARYARQVPRLIPRLVSPRCVARAEAEAELFNP